MKVLILILSLFFSFINLMVAQATNHYIDPSGSAGNDGLSWATPKKLSDIGATEWIRGDTYIIAGGNYTGTISLRTAASSTTRITLKKATPSDCTTHSSPTNCNGQAILDGMVVFQTPYWTLSGSYNTNSTSGHGLKILVASGKNKYGVYAGSYYGGGNDHHQGLIVQYVEVTSKDLYGQPIPQGGTCLTDATPTCAEFGIRITNPVVGEGPLEFGYNYIHDVGKALGFDGADTVTVHHNYLARNHSEPLGHGDQFGSNGGTNVSVYSNTFVDPVVAFIMLLNGGTNTNWKVYDNVFASTTYLVGSLFYMGNTGTTLNGLEFANNTVINVLKDPTTAGGGAVKNTTGDTPDGATAWKIRNNLWYCDRIPSSDCATATHITGAEYSFDKNMYLGVTYNVGENGMVAGAGNPFVSASSFTGLLTGGASPINAGADLSSVISAFDKYGIARDASWDIGACEYFGGVQPLYPVKSGIPFGVGN